MDKSLTTKKSRLKRIYLYVVVGVIFLVVLTLFLAPGIIKNYINNNGKELTGRAVQIEKLKLNYFTSTVKVIGFEFFEQNEMDVFIGFDTLMVNLKPLKLLKDEIYVQQLQLINPNCKIIQNDTVFNFIDLLDFYASEEEEQPDSTDHITYKLNLNKLEIKNGSFFYTDEQLDHKVKLKELSFIVPSIHWGRPDSSFADLAFDLSQGGRFSSSLNYNIDEGNFSGSAKIERLDLVTILPYVQQYMKFSDVDGTFSSDIKFSGSQTDLDQFEISGIFQLDSLKLKDEQSREVLGGQKYKVVLNSAKPMQQKVNIDLVELEKPYVYFALIDSLSNFEKMLVYSEEDTESSTTVNDSIQESILEVAVNQFVINNGLIDFSDQRFREDFNYELSEVTMDMDTLNLEDDWVNINANMKLNKRGTLNAELGMKPFDPLDSIQLNYVLTDFQLPDLNIYAKHYAGLPILFGDMYYINKTSIVNKQLESSNELIIRNVEMGRKSGGIYDIPIKLALFILKDINGDITLDVPVKGDLSDPKTRIGPIVWNTLKGFVVKIVASPFKALGGLLGANPKDLEEINFDYSDTTLVGKQIKSLDLLLDLEQKKPEIQIDLRYLNDKKLERTDAALELAHNLYFQKFNKKASANIKDYMKFLAAETQQDSLLMQDYELLIAPPEKIDSVIQYREILRMENVRNYLTEKNDSTKIRVSGYQKEEVLNIGSRPRMEVKYLLAEDAEEHK